MTDFITPNWHPIVVHFSVALITSASVVLLIAIAKRQRDYKEHLQVAGRMMFWIGFSALILTVLAGLQAYYIVAHDGPSHLAMTNHRNWALATLALSILSAGLMWRSRSKPLSNIVIASLMISTLSLFGTAYKGGDLVYRYGLGVASMPNVTGEGHDHEHSDGAGHDHGNETQDIDCGDGEQPHSHSTDDNEVGHDTAVTPLTTPEQVASALTIALKDQDKNTVKSLLHENVMVLESGHAQKSRQEYEDSHMLSDMAYLKAMDLETTNRSVSIDGDLAWVTSTTRMKGEFKDRQIDTETKELLIMRNQEGVWRITHIYWEN
jgi:uncharacterized membrane protein/ketosteroid isomerase-like protein